MNSFYTLDVSDFEQVEAQDLQEGDYLSFPGAYTDKYGCVRVDDIVKNDATIVAFYMLPVGVSLQSGKTADIHITWEDDKAIIEVGQYFVPQSRILRIKSSEHWEAQ